MDTLPKLQRRGLGFTYRFRRPERTDKATEAVDNTVRRAPTQC